ncbi:MAG: TolC family protein [Gammaproteobacteria bacterium]|nr:TolC family protein [Gammaproteobacteria bacterium]
MLGVLGNVSALTLSEAESIAQRNDPLFENHKAIARAWNNEAVADNQLPDPKLRFGLSNVPLDTLSTTQEPMTQFIVGVQQAFPKGDSLALKQLQSEWQAKAELARAEDRQRKLKMNIREDFFNLYYQVEAARIIRGSRRLFSQLVQITESQYASGRVNQQDVLRADLELSRLDDRAIIIQTEEEMLRADLSRWLGKAAWQPIAAEFPELPEISAADDINALITSHPAIIVENAKLEAGRQGSAIAKQQYKPGWGLSLEYRKRFGENPDTSDRADMMAAMATLDIPLFTENRQDKRVAASEEKISAVRWARDDQLRKLKQIYDRAGARLKGLDERRRNYKDDLIRSAESNTKSALKAYQSGVTEFTSLMRAHITELDIRLSDLRVRVDRSLAISQLLYISGEEK